MNYSIDYILIRSCNIKTTHCVNKVPIHILIEILDMNPKDQDGFT